MAAELDPARAAPRPVTLVRSIATVGGITLVSRVLGFVRDVMMAALLGAGPLSDAFFVAFKLPNFLRRLFAEGAFNAGFVPMFARILEGEGRAVAKTFAEQAQAALLAVLLPGGGGDRRDALGDRPHGPRLRRERSALPQRGRVLAHHLCYILFISLTALYGGVLNSLGRFAAAAAAPVMLNLSLIGAMIVSVLWLDAPAYALAGAPRPASSSSCGCGSRSARGHGAALRWPRLTPQVRRLWSLILPGAIGAGVAQINLYMDIVLASLLPPGAVSYLYYADRVNELPVGVIGVAVGTALLPLMARQLRAGQVAHAMHSQNRALDAALL